MDDFERRLCAQTCKCECAFMMNYKKKILKVWIKFTCVICLDSWLPRNNVILKKNDINVKKQFSAWAGNQETFLNSLKKHAIEITIVLIEFQLFFRKLYHNSQTLASFFIQNSLKRLYRLGPNHWICFLQLLLKIITYKNWQ